MKIDFENEVNALTGELKKADGYLECEAVVLSNIKKLMEGNIPIAVIEDHLKKLRGFFEEKVINKGNPHCANYRYAAGFLNTMIATPYWHSWINITD